MPTNRTPIERSRSRLSKGEELDLLLGTDTDGPVFLDEDERREAWEQHRDYVMARWSSHGKRPLAWWDYEAPIPRPRDPEYEEAALWEAGLLTPKEAHVLETRWREEFDRCHKPEWIGHCAGIKPGHKHG